jgi:type IV pilus assembly protein PilQ
MLKVESQDSGKLKIHIQNADLREVLDMLGEQGKLNILAGKEVQGKVSVSLEGVDIESALDAVLKSTGYAMRRQGKFIFVGTPDEFNNMEQALDRVGTRVFHPNYISAAELQRLIQPLLTDKIGMVSVSSAAEAGIAASDSTAGGDKYAGGEVVLVRDYQAVLNQIEQVVAEVDVRPLQVSIEAMVMSVKLNDSCKFGVDFAMFQNYMKFGWGTPATSLPNVSFDQGGLKFGYLDGNVGAFVNALESIGDTDVIAKPRVMVLNKHRAEILIGDKKGYVSTTVTETASTQTVDFLETGVQLRLRPFISRDGVIRMEVHPELSDGDVKVSGNFTLPNKSVTEVTSNIMVRDGCTVVIGGLIRDQKTTSTQAVPVFGSLPYVGFLFRNKTETTEREELIVLITPRIVYEPATCIEGKKDQCLFERRHDVYTDKMSPLGRRSIARRYLRLAQGRYEQGDRDTALRFAELAVHFDPQNMDAIEMRDSITRGGLPGANVAVSPMVGPATGMPGAPPTGKSPDVADWMLDDLHRDGPKPPVSMPMHPFDPGQPGTNRDILRPRQLP